MHINNNENKWYLLYTAPRAEKKVNAALIKRAFTTFLPLQTKVVQWSDRKKKVETPLFSSYIFIYTSMSFYYEILNTLGVVKFVNFQGQPVVLRDSQIELIKLMVANYEDIEGITETFEKGESVKIIKDERLRECNYGKYNGEPSSIVEPMQEVNISEPFPEGESYEDVKARIQDFLEDLKKNPPKVIAVPIIK